MFFKQIIIYVEILSTKKLIHYVFINRYNLVSAIERLPFLRFL